MTRSNTMAIKRTPLPAHPTRPTPVYAADELHSTYRVSMPDPWTHNIWVEMDIHRGGREGDLVLKMAVWTPGSYKLREFARNVSHFEAKDAKGNPIKWEMDDKQSWRIKAGNKKVVTVRYRLYAFEFSVRTPHCDDTHCFFQPTNVLMFVDGHLNTRSEMIISPYENWKAACPLPTLRGRDDHFLAENFDILADSPVEIGEHEIYSFEVSGKRHDIAIFGFGNHDPEQIVKDFRRIVLQAKRMFGDLPYENYMFILHLMPKVRGGLEHLNSQVSAWDSYGFDTRESYEEFLSLISHEFFHTWNVKRIRPEVLGPFDYTCEQYTRELWVMEGFTVYYEWLMLIRAGICDKERFLKAFAYEINRWEGRPGNSVMTLRDSSFLAWTKLYLADENFVNTGISYYLKGGLVALLLDFEIRERTKGEKSLDDVMRLAYRRYGWPKAGYPERGMEAMVAEVAGGKWKAWFAKYLDSTAPIDLKSALKKAGLSLVQAEDPITAASGKPMKRKILNWLGVELVEENAHVNVTVVRDGSPAQAAGISVKDELLAIENVRLRSKPEVAKLLALCDPGETISVFVYSGEFLRERRVTLGATPAGAWTLKIDKKASETAKAFCDAWLSNP